jgi:plastocyanin
MPDWSVKIVPAPQPTPAAPAAFQPDLIGSNPGDPLKVQDGDMVTWNNTTNAAHWPWRVSDGSNSPGQLCDPVPANASSRPSFAVNLPKGGTISYCCKYHPQEIGSVVVVPVGS